MNVLTFDTEEWYIEKAYCSARSSRYLVFDRYLKSILDLLDEQNLKATFFCVGGLAKEFPQVVRLIADKGHDIGCHSNTHKFLYAMDRETLKADTEIAIKSLEDVAGKKVMSYRAPALFQHIQMVLKKKSSKLAFAFRQVLALQMRMLGILLIVSKRR